MLPLRPIGALLIAKNWNIATGRFRRMHIIRIAHCLLFSALCMGFVSPLLSQATYDAVVARDGSGTYRTIQEAVNACRDYAERDYRVFVKNGVYEEKLLIPAWKTRITIVGENVDSTLISWNDYTGKLDSCGKKINTFTSFTCKVEGNSCSFENITFVNSAGRVGQAVALHVEGDRCSFRNCKLRGNQDTLFASGENSRQYYFNCTIEGTTDFIFGAATAVFENCTIVSKANSYVTAASTLPSQQYGFVFLHCRLLSDSAGRKVYLGRPWRLHAYTAFINCEMGSHIRPEGWHNWSKPEAERTARYYEYESTGPGANPSARVDWSHQLSAEAAAGVTPPNILHGKDGWSPQGVLQR
jgi:pectinesterase